MKRYFKEVHELDPYHTELMEYYSTALWHLQEEIALSALAKELSRFVNISLPNFAEEF